MKKVLFFLIACCVTASAAHANPAPLGGSGSIVVGSDNLTRILVAGPAVDTYNGSGTLVVAGPTIPAPSSLQLKLAMGGGLELGMFATDTWQYCQWYLNSANAKEGSSPVQTASYYQLGLNPDYINGSPTFYGFADDEEGNGLFGIEWPLAPDVFGLYGYVAGGAFDSTSGGAVYGYIQQGASIGFGETSNAGLLDLFLNDSYVTYVECFEFNENLVTQLQTRAPIGTLWIPEAVTGTVNKHVQVVWAVTSNTGATDIAVSDWNPSTNLSTLGPPIPIGAWKYSAASACSYGGDGLVRVLMNLQGNWFLMTVNPVTGAVGGASV